MHSTADGSLPTCIYQYYCPRSSRSRRIFLNLYHFSHTVMNDLMANCTKLHQEEKWNHCNFMRMIWCLFKMNDRRSAMRNICRMSPYNITFTYSWSQIIFYGMHNFANCDDPKRDSVYFLIVDSSLCNDFDSILQKYYSPKLVQKVKENSNDDDSFFSHWHV